MVVDAKRATQMAIGLLSFEGFDIAKDDEGLWRDMTGITFVDGGGDEQRLHRYDIYGGYVGDRARRASIIVQPSTRAPEYAEEQLLPVKVSETIILAVNVVSRAFSKNQQDQLISVCDNIELMIDQRPGLLLGSWANMWEEGDRKVGPGEVWADDEGRVWVINEPDGPEELSVPSMAPLNKEIATELIGENYIRVVSTDYNDEIQFGTRRGENVATVYVSLYSNPHISTEAW